MHTDKTHTTFAATFTTADHAEPERPARAFPEPDTRLYETIEHHAVRELEWYFAKPEDRLAQPGAEETITGWLAALASYHRGALVLRYDSRSWPGPLAGAFAGFTSMAVRLYCADHPAIGGREALEQAAAQKLVEIVRASGDDDDDLVEDLWMRAMGIYEEALVAYMTTRGTGSCVVPRRRRKRPRSQSFTPT